MRGLKKETSIEAEKGKDLDRPDFFDTFRIVSDDRSHLGVSIGGRLEQPLNMEVFCEG